MRNSYRLLGALGALLLLLPTTLSAQSNSLSAFSPYTFYGLGDMSVQGSAFFRSMGGAGVAYSNYLHMNSLNPASYASVMPRSVLFNVGGEMYNTYANTADAKTSYNTFNIRDINMLIPLTRGLGFGFTMTPLSDVGYRVKMTEMDPLILANVGNVVYEYLGEGNTTQFKFGLGWNPFKNFAFGVDVIYYHGIITRNFNTIITPVISETTERTLYGKQREIYSKAGVIIGAQYNLLANDLRQFTIGMTYRPRVNLRPQSTRSIVAEANFVDTIDVQNSRFDYYLPSSFSVGLAYTTLNAPDPLNGITYSNNHYIKAGVQFVPNPQDVRRYFNRMSYRLGFRYNNYYMNINGHNIDDKAITLGFGFPIRQGLSNINIGFDFGQRGLTASGVYNVPATASGGMASSRAYQMVRERYFRVSIELSFFGEDYWFLKPKYE